MLELGCRGVGRRGADGRPAVADRVDTFSKLERTGEDCGALAGERRTCGPHAWSSVGAWHRASAARASTARCRCSHGTVGCDAAGAPAGRVRALLRRRGKRGSRVSRRGFRGSTRCRRVATRYRRAAIRNRRAVSRRVESRHAAVEPRNAAVEPRNAAVEPRHAAVEPRHAVVESRHAAVEPRHAAIEQRCAAVDPCHAAVEPRHATVSLDAGPSRLVTLSSCCDTLPSSSVALPSSVVTLPSSSDALPSSILPPPSSAVPLPSSSDTLPARIIPLPDSSVTLPSGRVVSTPGGRRRASRGAPRTFSASPGASPPATGAAALLTASFPSLAHPVPLP